MGNKKKIFLAEDEEALGMIVKESLESRDYEVFWAKNGEQVLQKLKEDLPDILVLDVMMPKLDGFTVASEIRKSKSDLPIIFLTSKSQTKDVLKGYESGGNDYVRKPFSIEELILRIEELTKRSQRIKEIDQFQIASFHFDFDRQQLEREGDTQLLTFREAEVLKMLVQKPNELVDKGRILNDIWGDDDFYNARSLDVFITKLRKKLSKDESIKIINVRGYGYKLCF